MKKLLLLIFLFGTLSAKAQNANCLSFDGVDDQVLVPNASSLIVNSNKITLTCWVYPTNALPVFPDYDGFCGFRDNIFGDFYLVHFGQGRLEARFRNDLGVNFDIIDTGLQVNTWQHYALVYSEPELSLFRNGVLIGSTIANGTITSPSDPFYIGNMLFQGTNYWLTGKIDEVSLWNRALSAAEIGCISDYAIYPAGDSLKLYFDFNQGIAAGNNANDTILIDRSLHLDGELDGFALSGFSSNYVPGVTNYTTAIRQLCPGDSIDFNGQWITSAGTYSSRYRLGTACDSIAYLTVTRTDTSVTQSGSTLTATQPGALYQWLECDNNFAPIPGANSRVYTATANGNYAVIVTQGICTDTSGCRFVLISGIGGLDNQMFKAYPNPVTDVLHLRTISSTSASLNVIVSDALGNVVINERFNGTDIDLPFSNLSAGVYTVNLFDGKDVARIRVVKAGQ